MPRTSPPRKDKNRVPREKREIPAAPKKDAERVAKVIARAGLGSRREIEDWIAEGRIAVNGEVLASPAVTVTAADAITVDGAPLPERERTRLFLYHKPKGVVTTNRDPEGRTTLFEILPRGLPRLVSVGRLDLNSEGLLLLTNDGGLARALELPETGWLRRYRVRANGAVDQAMLDTLLGGITVEGVEYGPIEAVLDRTQGANSWITVSLREGKNREVRNVLAALGLSVNRLIRVSYGPFQLGEIAEGAAEEVRTRVLRDQIGAEIAAAAGVDFEGPISDFDVEEAPPARPLRPAGKRQAQADAPGGTKGRPARDSRPEGRGRPEARGWAEDAPRTGPGGPRGPRGRRPDDDREIESRGTVADRKGRPIKVERVVSAAPASGRPLRAGAGKGFGKAGPARRGARFEEMEGAGSGRPLRGRPGGGMRRGPEEGRFDEARPPRRPRPEGGFGGAGRGPSRPFRDDGERPPRRPRPEGGGRGFGDESRGPARERGFDEGHPARGPRPEGGFGGAGRGPSRPFRDDGERPPRRPRPEGGGQGFGGESRGPARERGFDEGRPPRGPRPEGGFGGAGRGPSRPFREDGERPPRRPRPEGGFGGPGRGPRRGPSEGGFDRGGRERTFDGTPDRGSDRPQGGGYAGPRSFRRPGAEEGDSRPSGGRPGAGKSFGNKSFGSKPAGRPEGGRSFGGKPVGRPSGGKSFGGKSGGGGRPSGGKPGGRPSGGGRPGGGKPFGGKR
mgnify:CR=1 FL=1